MDDLIGKMSELIHDEVQTNLAPKHEEALKSLPDMMSDAIYVAVSSIAMAVDAASEVKDQEPNILANVKHAITQAMVEISSSMRDATAVADCVKDGSIDELLKKCDAKAFNKDLDQKDPLGLGNLFKN
jgi:hypothetical protein